MLRVVTISLLSLLSNIVLGQNCNALYIAGIIDGPLTNGVPKAIQVCANEDISDLSAFGIGTANNGGGSNGVEFTLPAIPLDSATCYTISSESMGFLDFFGCPSNVTSSVASINGDDAIELFCNGTLTDVFGDPDVDGTGEVWEYLDGWAVSSDSIPSVVFNIAEWTLSGINALDGETSNATATIPYPLVICGSLCQFTNAVAGTQSICDTTDNTYTQSIELHYINAPSSGMIDINGQTFPIVSSPQNILLVDLNSDGSLVDATMSFTDQPGCSSTFSNLFMAPSSCSGGGNSTMLDTMRIMTYNLLNFPNPGNSNANGNDAARAVSFRKIIDDSDPDVIILQEIKSLSGLVILTAELNANGTLGYIYDHAPSWTGYGGLGNGLIFKTESINYVSQMELPRSNSANAPNGNAVIAPRANTLYHLNLINSICTDTQTIDIISGHFKAGSNAANGSDIADNENRNLSVLDALDYTNTLPITSNIIIGGDTNFRSDDNNSGSDSEPGYVNLVDVLNTTDFIDPLGGFVRNQSFDAHKYTQATRLSGTNHYGNGGVSGGLDDRFDFLFVSEAIHSGSNNVTYINNTYDVPGSPGILNGESCNSGLPLCLDYRAMSDHYPVILDFEVAFNNCSIPCVSDVIVVQDFVMGQMETIEASHSIQAANHIGGSANIIYKAGQEVLLGVNFQVDINAVFEILLAPCGQ